MEASRSSSTLLDAGTNEFEIIEFLVSGQSFGVNVSKVKQIVQFDEKLLTEVPKANAHVKGLFLFRGSTVTLVDLRKALNLPIQECAIPLVLVTEFNGELTAFLIDGVNRIHRIAWSQIQPLNSFLGNFVSSFTGSINIEEREILIVDLEQIVAEINPDYDLGTRLDSTPAPVESPSAKQPSSVKIALAEDSSFMRKGMVDALKRAGFAIAGVFDNGLSAYEFVKDCSSKASSGGQGVESFFDILVTDIEMPRMDGLTLARNVRALGLASVPIVVFSSIVNTQMVEKAKAAGVSSFVSKPKMEELKGLILNAVSAS